MNVKRFPPELEAQFRASRMAALAEINVTTFWLVAILVMIFSWWDWFVDPVNWKTAFMIRVAGAIVILGTGLTQRISKRVDWASHIARVRYLAACSRTRIVPSGALRIITGHCSR